MIDKETIDSLLSLLIVLGEKAEKIRSEKIIHQLKSDGSPLSVADSLINEELNRFIKDTKFTNIISEENSLSLYKERKNWKYYWVIDPIDGTKEFINGGDDYTINVALCFQDLPILSVITRPAKNDIYFAIEGEGAYKNNSQIRVSKKSNEIKACISKSHSDEITNKYLEILRQRHVVQTVGIGSSLKFCKVAEGSADIYPRFGRTMEWDICAAALILKEAGGFLYNHQGNVIRFNSKTLESPKFLAMNDISFKEDFVNFISKL